MRRSASPPRAVEHHRVAAFSCSLSLVDTPPCSLSKPRLHSLPFSVPFVPEASRRTTLAQFHLREKSERLESLFSNSFLLELLSSTTNPFHSSTELLRCSTELPANSRRCLFKLTVDSPRRPPSSSSQRTVSSPISLYSSCACLFARLGSVFAGYCSPSTAAMASAMEGFPRASPVQSFARASLLMSPRYLWNRAISKIPAGATFPSTSADLPSPLILP